MYTVSYKYKVYRQNDSHKNKLDALLSLCRAVYNHTIALNRRFYSLYGKGVGSCRSERKTRLRAVRVDGRI